MRSSAGKSSRPYTAVRTTAASTAFGRFSNSPVRNSRQSASAIEAITSANDVDNVLYRIDMPGHIKHKNGDTFEQIYLSYHGAIPAKEFAKDFAPDKDLKILIVGRF